jgi:SAM-dependent methyltransferase
MAGMTRSCSVCGGTTFGNLTILSDRLVAEWDLSPAEADYVNRQQGEYCLSCHANLRSIVLADALRAVWGTRRLLRDFCRSPDAAAISVLELNQAGMLHPYLAGMPGHRLAAYPDIDMLNLPYKDGAFDVVVHSDTLEHVPDPVCALAECLRVTRPGGAVCYTVPIVVGRMSRDRTGLPASHHGPPDDTRDDFLVHTEFGADVWTYPMRAGCSEVRIFSVDHPTAHAIAAFRGQADIEPSVEAGSAVDFERLAAIQTEEARRQAMIVDVMRRSTSWRVTAPLRALGRLLRQPSR